MNTYITIVDTEKAGFLTVNTNALYTGKAVETKQMNIRKSIIRQINTLRDPNGGEYVIVQTQASESDFALSNDLTQSRYFPVESINGVAPSSVDDLKEKILNLL